MPETSRITGMGSREEFTRQADEAIFSEDGKRQHNSTYAKGLWVWMV